MTILQRLGLGLAQADAHQLIVTPNFCNVVFLLSMKNVKDEVVLELISFYMSLRYKEDSLSEILGDVELESDDLKQAILDLIGFPKDGEGGIGIRANPNDYETMQDYFTAYGFSRDSCGDVLWGFMEASKLTAEERFIELKRQYEQVKS